MAVRLISVSQPIVPGVKTAEDLIAYCARVSNPNNQIQDPTRLLKYCIKNKHWSIFEQANMVLEIKTTRAIAAQILRHRTFTFQEFSQRYANVVEIIQPAEARLQDTKNRQNSFETSDQNLKDWFEHEQLKLYEQSVQLYNDAVAQGIAKESARFVLPLSTPTTLYMNGTIRSWITYCDLRSDNGTQKEHREIAEQCKKILYEQFPITSAAMWGDVNSS